MDEEHLPGHIPLRQPPHLLFPNHWNDLAIIRNHVTEGPVAIVIPAMASAAVPIGVSIGYFVGHATDKSAPEFVIGR